MQLNPDILGADEIILPQNWKDMTGWTDGKVTEREAIGIEHKQLAELEDDLPIAFRTRAPRAAPPERLKQWNDFQQSKGRYPGSNDMTLLDQFLFGKDLTWLAQIIGSCVWSNTGPIYVVRHNWEIGILRAGEEYLGIDEFGPHSCAPYGPWSYGMARRRAGMNSGDGLYCAPMAESLMKDAVMMCSTPKLLEILQAAGVADEEDFPEPQGKDGAAFYRKMGNWAYLDELKPFAAYPVLESPSVKSADQLWDLLGDGKPSFVCSSEAIRKVGTHPDGFAIHARDPNDSWSHNMNFQGRLVASDGERFIREANTSWDRKGQPTNIYNRRFDEVAASFRSGRLTSQAIGEIGGRQSAPFATAA